MVRKFYRSNQFMLTLKQLEWLESQGKGSASKIIRALIDIAMSNVSFEQDVIFLTIYEDSISKLEGTERTDKLEELKQQRQKLLLKLSHA